MRILELQTPADLYGIVESEDAWGGRVLTTTSVATLWGDFRPEPPASKATGEGDAYVVQTATFLCRDALGAVAGGLVHLGGFDWRILSVDGLAGGMARLIIERVHG